jgi:hypothetical protein
MLLSSCLYWNFPEFPSVLTLESCASYLFSVGFFLFFVLMSGLILVILAAMIYTGFKLLIGKE